MQDRVSQIQFITANYSRLQGLRAVPVGILAVFVSIWTLYHQGPSADLSAPILVAMITVLLYWLTDLYYHNTFGEIKRTTRQRTWELFVSVVGGVLGLLAFLLDSMKILPISAIGLVFAASFLEYFWRAKPSEWRKIFTHFPENIVAAILVMVISIMPLFGIFWWKAFGLKSQVIAIFMVVGIVIIVTGILGHFRLIRALSAVETRSNDNAI
jgi:hypothetical protein